MPSSVPTAGTHLLHYRVIERLGGGGMGEVFLAEDTRLGRQVALKFLTSADAHDPEARSRLVREARAASVLRSPHVAVTYDLVEHGSDLFIAMEYVEGELLSDRVGRGILPVPEALEIAMQVADALDEAHGHGIVHRDIKSANVMLTRRQLVKVLDFGLAKFLRPSALDDAATIGVTIPGVVLGTLHYMAPEQLRGGDIDHRADLFAVGAVLYEMLAGRPPFQADTMADTAHRILTQEPDALARFNYAVPADVEAVVRKALAKDPEFRYQSARELYVDLHHARERLVRESSASGARVTWRPGMLLPPVGFGQPAPVRPAGERTVAVLTFANLTGNPADEWIGQGIAESLTIDFAKVRGVKPIPREQMFDVQRELSNAQGRVVDERQSIELGRRLGATWVVGGAVQRLGDRVRLTAQTIAVDEGHSVSTVKLDGTMDQIFELQDRLVEELVRTGLQRELQSSEKRAIGEDVRSPEAYEAYSRGMLNLRIATQESTERAIALFERALELDAGYVEALVALGSALQLRGSFLSLPHVLERSRALLEKAVAIAPQHAEAHVRLGQTLVTLGEVDAAEAAIRQGLALEPGPVLDVEAHALHGRPAGGDRDLEQLADAADLVGAHLDDIAGQEAAPHLLAVHVVELRLQVVAQRADRVLGQAGGAEALLDRGHRGGALRLRLLGRGAAMLRGQRDERDVGLGAHFPFAADDDDRRWRAGRGLRRRRGDGHTTCEQRAQNTSGHCRASSSVSDAAISCVSEYATRKPIE